jgi:hypothetical protein
MFESMAIIMLQNPKAPCVTGPLKSSSFLQNVADLRLTSSMSGVLTKLTQDR